MALSQLFTLFTQKMNYLAQRQGVIAENIANANTPNYKPKDLEPFDKVMQQVNEPGAKKMTAARVSSLPVSATDPGHMGGGARGGNETYKVEKEKDFYEVKPAGNAVVLEQQLTQLGETNANYQMITSLYRKTMGMLKTALGRTGA
jgi:flagellar basal-body rod protein FlgB